MAAEDVAAARRELVARLKRAEGQVRAVAGLVEAGGDCEAIAQQLAAARKALDRAFYELMACALEHPQFSAQPGERTAARVRRLTRTLARLG
ncbi:MAG: metal-sensitive transcriptional regulator [Burkholderiales bacterium]|jgi:DNA-binding FrmR family transcriptional regulator|nr:metal-sensitive transcriptional regulator [Burkholderiales bacterium]